MQTTNLVGELAAERLVLEAARVVQVLAVHLPGQDDAELHHLLHGDGGEGLHRDVIVQLRHSEESRGSLCVCVASVNVVSLKRLIAHLLDWTSCLLLLLCFGRIFCEVEGMCKIIKGPMVNSMFDRQPNSLIIHINIHRNRESVNSQKPPQGNNQSRCFNRAESFYDSSGTM